MIKSPKRNKKTKITFASCNTPFWNKKVEIVIYTIESFSTNKKNKEQLKYIAPASFESRKRAVINTHLQTYHERYESYCYFSVKYCKMYSNNVSIWYTMHSKSKMSYYSGIFYTLDVVLRYVISAVIDTTIWFWQ